MVSTDVKLTWDEAALRLPLLMVCGASFMRLPTAGPLRLQYTPSSGVTLWPAEVAAGVWPHGCVCGVGHETLVGYADALLTYVITKFQTGAVKALAPYGSKVEAIDEPRTQELFAGYGGQRQAVIQLPLLSEAERQALEQRRGGEPLHSGFITGMLSTEIAKNRFTPEQAASLKRRIDENTIG